MEIDLELYAEYYNVLVKSHPEPSNVFLSVLQPEVSVPLFWICPLKNMLTLLSKIKQPNGVTAMLKKFMTSLTSDMLLDFLNLVQSL